MTTTLAALLSELVEREPEAVLAIDGGPGTPAPVTREALLRRTFALRADLLRAGVGPGDCVAVWLPNWSDALCWQFATAALGAHVIGVNTRYNVDEVAHVLDRARPAVLAIAHEFHGLDLLGRLHRALEQSGVAPPSVAVVPGPHAPATPDPAGYDVGAGAWVPSDPSARRTRPPAAGDNETGSDETGGDETGGDETGGDELAVAFTTSGSTGRPKLAAHRESAVVAHAIADARRIGMRPGDVVACILPLSGVFGFNTAMAAIAAGATCLLEPVFDGQAVVADMERHRVSHVIGGDDMVLRLARAWRDEPRDLSGWRWLGMANLAGRAHELARWATERFGTLASGVYGASEVFALALLWPDEEPTPRRWEGGGYPVTPGSTARAIDPVTEEPMPTGEQGELQLRGPNVVDAYLGDPGANAAFTADGWFRTGDLVRIDPDGGIVYVCRMGDELRLRGFLVDPAEIEYRLIRHKAVETVKVVGIRGADGATEAVGFVVPVPGSTVDGETLREWCAEGLAKFKVPGTIHLVEQMPTTSGSNGTKIRAKALREWAQRSYDEQHAAQPPS